MTSFRSRAVRGLVRMEVYLPSGYASSRRRYPVIYFLHGLPASSTSYRGVDYLRRALDRAGRPAILVAPQGARDHDSDPEYLDWEPGRNWETAVGRELPALRRPELPDDPEPPRPRSRRPLCRRLRRHAPRHSPPRGLRRRGVVERVLPPDEPERHRPARPRLAGGERESERTHVRPDPAPRLPPPADLLRLLRRPRRHALPGREPPSAPPSSWPRGCRTSSGSIPAPTRGRSGAPTRPPGCGSPSHTSKPPSSCTVDLTDLAESAS